MGVRTRSASTTSGSLGGGSRARVGRRVALCLTLVGALVIPTLPAAAIEPNQVPITEPDSATALSGQVVLVPVLANDQDPDDSPSPLSLVSAAVTNPAAGSAAVAGSDVAITVASSFVGTLSATYVVTDGADTAQGSISVQVTRPNSAPEATADSAVMWAGDTLRIDPRTNDSDPDGDPLTVVAATLSPAEAGVVALDGSTVVLTASRAFKGTTLVTYTLSDGRGATSRGTITVTVKKRRGNQRPVAVDDSATILAGRTYLIAVLKNDSDPEGQRIRIDRVRKASGTSKVRATKSGSAVKVRAQASYAGTVRIRYRIKDSRGARDWGLLTVIVQQPERSPNASRTQVEQSLARLGIPVGRVDGRYDSGTRRAVCAWRTIMGKKAHRGLPSSAEARAIADTSRLPRARSLMVTGVTVSVTCQAAFWVGSDRSYRRVMRVSTGKPGYRTRNGTFRVFRAFRTWRYSTIYPEARMYKPLQFSGGQAIHGSSTDALVKTYPASHGCVRMLHRDVDALHAGGFGLGSQVRVIGRW